ncbi:enoyl-CoA hydratase/isomerase family protein [Photobacterium sanguinicancri]|uniref:Enoyl-CoA hydratase/isomerase family protein n=1 Tax=Photobacterium sanguinicancri TaxID=875932 RepID=A0ABX4FTH7_9GAMM|nr:enoyl-CoA hydratase/isomerase family protein [Photobacterium sanguinicancri]KXI24489.1 crotonase [Photobacterium sanguinicancri]OZS42147.1 enoyl-CoA hydratase/isomerase family protein [Photobacterium sanguinicancri]
MDSLSLSNIAASHLLTSIKNDVLTITMNRPHKLNGWTMDMMESLKEAFSIANTNDNVKAIILTGVGKYYSAGVNLAGTLKVMPPKALHELIVKNNQRLFEVFLNCNKPLLIAINGPAIGASVTSATLANRIVTADNATFSTPFSALGITPEGCSSYHFPRLLGEANCQRMLGKEGWKPNAEEALTAGLVQSVVPQPQLMEEAHRIAQNWVVNKEDRQFLAGSSLKELQAANAKESVQLADAFFSAAFLKNQAHFFFNKKKYAPSITFFMLWALRPLWARFM